MEFDKGLAFWMVRLLLILGLLHVSTTNLSLSGINYEGNPLICGQNAVNNCTFISVDPLSLPPDDLKDQYDPEARLGHLKRYSFKELRVATNHFPSKNILGKGRYDFVYKGCLRDGTIVAVKRLKNYDAVGGEIQFQTEMLNIVV